MVIRLCGTLEQEIASLDKDEKPLFLKEYGLIKGFFKGTKRVLSCHPIKFLGGGEGFKPVKKNKN